MPSHIFCQIFARQYITLIALLELFVFRIRVGLSVLFCPYLVFPPSGQLVKARVPLTFLF